MTRFLFRIILLFLAFVPLLHAEEKGELKLKPLYNTLDPLSVPQHLAFYELYPETALGKKALGHAWELLTEGKKSDLDAFLPLPKVDIQAIISLVTRQASDPIVKLSDEQLTLIEKISAHLGNRRFPGSQVWTKEELLALPSEKIDLGRGILIHQFEESANPKDDIRQYEASLDLMALQILARLPKSASDEDKIQEVNRFIFHEMQFRFPPHSLHVKDIDLYTFLPSVLDSRQGVCLGVSILYLCLAQRLDLPLEIITPPGHIYVRYHKGERLINIETTARGIHMPSETYLGIDTRKLQERTLKEVIGMAFFNQASVFWGKGDYAKTVALYEKALPYLPDDPLVKMFLGLNYLFIGKKKEGKQMLEPLRNFTFDFGVSPETIPADYLAGNIDAEVIKAIFLPVDEKRDSVVEKQKELEKIILRYPHFRAGLLQLATTWLQLGRGSEALQILERYHRVDPGQATVQYYLAILCMERFDYNRAWQHLALAETIVASRSHNPKALKSVKNHLRRLCPEPSKT